MPAKPRPPAKKATKSHRSGTRAVKIPATLAQALEAVAKDHGLRFEDLVLHLLELNIAALAAAVRRRKRKA